MLIGHLNVARGFRGGERQTELLLSGLHNAGEHQHYALCRDGEPLAQRLNSLGIRVESARKPFAWRARPLGGTALLHAHDGKSVHVARALKRRFGLPYIVTRRVDNPIGTNRWTRRAYSDALRVVTISQAIANIVKRYDPAIATTVIPSASAGFRADANRARRLRTSFGGNFIIAQVGALSHRHKGQLFTIEVARRLAREHPGFRFVLIGAGEDEAMLRDAASDCPNVLFAGQVDNVGDYLAACDMMLFPSQNEGLGSSIIDAMCAGLPVLGHEVGGIPELVAHGHTGYLVQPGDTVALANHVVELWRNADLRLRMGEAAAQRAEGFSQSAMVSAYQALYDTLLSRPMREA